MDYILSLKLENVLDTDKKFTKFNKYTRIVTCSQNLRRNKPVKSFQVETIQEVNEIVQNFKNNFKKEHGYEPFSRQHCAFWEENGKKKSRLQYFNIHDWSCDDQHTSY